MKCLINQQFVSVNLEEGSAIAQGHHPVLYVSAQINPFLRHILKFELQVKDMEVTKSEELIILKFDDRESKEPVMFGQSICLVTPDGYFLAFKSNGELKVEKN